MTEPARPFVSVIVPVRNGERTLGDCLASILASDFPEEGREVVVVDNGSSDRTAEIALKLPVRYVTEPRRGLSHARNRGIAAARGEIVASTDADCHVATSWLRELAAGFDDPDVFVVAGEVIAFPPTTPVERYVAIRRPSVIEWTLHPRHPWFTFASAAVRRDAFERAGVFDPRFAGGSEDIDLAWRFARAGLAVRRRPQALVFHRHRTTAAQLFRQHVGYGRGQAALSRKHPGEVLWTWSNELAAWRDVCATAWQAATVYATGGAAARRSMRAYYPYLDLVRKLGQRIGFLEGRVLVRSGGRSAG
jgi:glycosyltransferase involved in cell wall biosynthesis